MLISIKIIVSICSKPLCLSAWKKSTSSLTSFLRYCNKIANLLFWVLWACLKNDSINLQKTSMFICMPKINFIFHFFPDMILTNNVIYNDMIYTYKWLEYFLWSLTKHFIRLQHIAIFEMLQTLTSKTVSNQAAE